MPTGGSAHEQLTRAQRRKRTKEAASSGVAPSRLYPDVLRDVFPLMSAVQRMEAIGLYEDRAVRPETFREYVDRLNPDFMWPPHLIALASVLQDVADGLRTRVMAFMPPRHGKSEMISRLFTAYYLDRHPTLQVALTTYGAELSYELSRDARNNYLLGGGTLSEESSAVKTWSTAAGGRLWATGVGGPATGRGYHLGVIDDPYKDQDEAQSSVIRKSRLNWYRAVFRTRAAPGAAIVILLTRWHQDDLVSTLIREENETRQGWHILEFAAEKQVPLRNWPTTVTLEPDVRDHPRWLWAERFTPEEYENIKRGMGGSGGYYWNALYQQRPVSPEGGLFKEAWFKRTARELLPVSIIAKVRSWDLAASENTGAYTAGVEVWKSSRGDYYIVGLEHGQWHAGRRDEIIVTTAIADGKAVWQTFPLDPGAAGKQVGHEFVRKLNGISPVRLMPQSGSKQTRATMPASAASNGLVYIVDEPWAVTVIQELTAAGEGAEFWDIVDAFSDAYAFLSPMKARASTSDSHSQRTNR